MESSTTITTQIFCHAGSVYEDKKTNGLSHFLEHMFFKGGKKYPTPEVLNKLLDSIGAEFNAYTSDYFASYYVKSSPEYRATGLDVLADMICHATLPAEEIEKEKDVILQELQMYRDQPRQWMLMNAKTRYH
ncbi:insulinase family protein [Patescibacteria group bacterium]|nr:insulinase family protein [Patescibacteria group bacterium]